LKCKYLINWETYNTMNWNYAPTKYNKQIINL